MKKILHFLFILLAVAVVIILYISYLSNHNQNYLKDITKKIQENYQVEEEITYSNQYGNYYIFTTNKNVVVLNKEYVEVLKEDITTLQEKETDMELIYKTNQLMYEKKSIKNKTLTYEYYNAKTMEFIKSTTMEQK
ncbi:MAG: hypothetical protein MR598_07680 [Erysipelotrichaceae bacterium]|nr:hypothetical protein [Erysipelotrichaceae bacterium]